MKKITIVLFAVLTASLFGACGSGDASSIEYDSMSKPDLTIESTTSKITTAEEMPSNAVTVSLQKAEENTGMKLMLGDTAVTVKWEENESVKALKELCKVKPLTIKMSKYGGFEQVGSIGQSLPKSDSRTTTQSGDIVLYSGDQLVVFYGSNTWEYTRLGKITNKSADELSQILGHDDVTITIKN